MDPIRIKRIYEPVEEDDGLRILVDGLWPRGVSRSGAALHSWMKALAPSKVLRQWFGHDPRRWQTFRQRYRDELARQPEALSELLDLCRSSRVTLLYGARDQAHNQAAVLREVLAAELAEEASPNEPSSPACWATDEWYGPQH